VKNIMKAEGGDNDAHISNREQVGGGKKQKNVAYCDEKKVSKTDLEECGTLFNLESGNLWLNPRSGPTRRTGQSLEAK
jgi:hypothetical protein